MYIIIKNVGLVSLVGTIHEQIGHSVADVVAKAVFFRPSVPRADGCDQPVDDDGDATLLMNRWHVLIVKSSRLVGLFLS